MNDRFKFRVYVTENDAYPEKVGYVNTEDFYIHPDGEESYFNADYDFAESVIEQCTGLKDKNGKLIYEGDIVLKSDVSAIGYSRTRVCKVHWHNDWLSWAITTQYGDTYELSEFESQQYEIIGNIHENKDLLENEECYSD